MKLQRKIELVKEWGFEFESLVEGFTRVYYADTGWKELWFATEPDNIAFYKDGEFQHDYAIDWSLFK